jgi:hypothetical protein
MTETQWPTCQSPEAMLNALTDEASPRKLRLYAVGCCRRIWHLLHDDRCRHAVEVAQRFVDGRATAFDLEAAGRTVAGVARVWGDVGSAVARSTFALGGAAWAATRASAWLAAWDAAWDARVVARDQVRGTDWEKERAWQAGLLRDLVGDPFRPLSVEPTWLTPDVLRLARVIYDESRFGEMPYLADALLDAGCDDDALLEHCHGREPHYRGCWVIDLLLGYE